MTNGADGHGRTGRKKASAKKRAKDPKASLKLKKLIPAGLDAGKRR